MTETVRDQPCQQSVAEHVPKSVSVVRNRHAFGSDHVQTVVEQMPDQFRRGGGIVSIVTVHQDENISFYIREHSTNDMAFALLALFPDDCAVLTRHLYGPVGGVVVVHVNRCIGQRLAKILDNRANTVFFVETGNEHGNTMPALLNPAACPAFVIYWIFNGLHHEQILPDAANNERELCTVFRPETVT
jgi:hypothetical protein